MNQTNAPARHQAASTACARYSYLFCTVGYILHSDEHVRCPRVPYPIDEPTSLRAYDCGARKTTKPPGSHGTVLYSTASFDPRVKFLRILTNLTPESEKSPLLGSPGRPWPGTVIILELLQYFEVRTRQPTQIGLARSVPPARAVSPYC